MPLTPDDVANKRFTPTRFKTGYDEEEVDAFLDEVEAELRRLLTENAELRQALQQAGSQPAAPAASPVAVEAPSIPTQVPTPPPPAAAPPAPEAPVGRDEPEGQALRTLLLAQRTADEAIAQAKAEAEQIVAGAKSQAALVEQEAARQHAAAMVDFQRQRNSLEAAIDGLRSFEREYRTRLKAYLEGQLRDLNSRGQIAPPGGPPAAADAGATQPFSAGGAGAGGSAEQPRVSPFTSAPPTPSIPGLAPRPTSGAPRPTPGAPTSGFASFIEDVDAGSDAPARSTGDVASDVSDTRDGDQ